MCTDAVRSKDSPGAWLECQWTLYRFRSVAVAKIMYASCAWSGFVSKRDEQRIDAFLRRNKKCGFCQPDLPTFQELCDTVDEQLFDKIQRNKNHLLHYLLPPPSAASQCYNLRRRPHSQLLPQHSRHLMDSNFIKEYCIKTVTDAVMFPSILN